MKPIPYGKQHISSEDIAAVTTALQSDFLTQGPRIQEFEEAFAKYIGSQYAVAVANGTAALHLAAMALGVKAGDKVITTPVTFSASANCVRYCGGEVVFSDIDPNSFLLDVEKVKVLLEASPKGTYAGIIPVDFAGMAVDLTPLRQLADRYGLWILEDACHAPGAFFTDQNNKPHYCGSGVDADLAIFSFHPVKHIAAGEGGMITTNSKSLYEHLLMLRTHGITRDPLQFQNSVELASGSSNDTDAYPGWYMEMQELGYNYRLTDFQSALGLSQLKRADAGLKRRREIAKRYDLGFKGHASIKSQQNELGPNAMQHAYHLYVIQVPDRLGLYNYLRTQGIYPQVHYIPVHLMPYYQAQGWKLGDFPAAEHYYERCLSLPMYPTLTDEEVDFVIEKVRAHFQ